MSGWAAVAQTAGETFNLIYGAQRANQLQGFQKQVRVNEQEREDSKLRRIVNDAQAAGLHPLFALGTGGSYGSGGQSFPGATGSYAGEGIARIGKIAGDYIRGQSKPKKGEGTAAGQAHMQQRELIDLQKDKIRAETRLDELEGMKRWSDMKYAEQRNLYWGDSNPGITGPGNEGFDGSKLYAYDKAPAGLELRPTMATPKTSRPLMTTMIAPDGYRYSIIDPDSGDEISQVDLAQAIILRYTRKARKAPGRELKLQFQRMARAMKRKWRSMNSGKSKHYRNR